MALLSSPVSSLINGVSQQPASLRFPGQVESQENAYSSIAAGLTKRHPSQHVAGPLVGVDDISGSFSHLINRDSGERYAAVVFPSDGEADLKVFDLLTGDSKTIRDPNGHRLPAESNTAREFGNPNTVNYFSRDSTPELETGGPFAFSFWFYLPAGASGGTGLHGLIGKLINESSGEYSIERNDKLLRVIMYGAAPTSLSFSDALEDYEAWYHIVVSHDGSAVNVYVNGVKIGEDVPATVVADSSADFRLGRIPISTGDAMETGRMQYVGFWKKTAGYPLNDDDVATLYNDSYGLAYDGLTAGLMVDLVSFWNLEETEFYGSGNAIDKAGSQTLTEEGTVGTGDPIPSMSNPFGYIDTADMGANLRAVTVVDHTWLVDSTVTAAMDATSLTPTRKNEALVVIWKYKHAHTYKLKVEDKTFQYRTRKSGVGTGDTDAKLLKQENRSAAQSQGWLAEQLFIELGGISDVTSVDLTTIMHPAANVGGTAANDVWGTGGQVGGVDINNNGEGLDGDGGSNTGAGGYDGWVVKQTGPVIHIYREDEADFDISVVDSSGDDALTVIKNEVQILADLPTKAPHGMNIKIVGDEEEGVDDEYYVEFSVGQARTEDEAYRAERQYGAATTDTEAMSDGVWEESTASGIPNKIDGNTMPHKLVRLSDGSFIFRKADWAEMPVGDATTNPQASFIGEKIRDIFFFKNRLGLLADDNVIMSETGDYNMFWRTKIVQLLDSDPIDVGIAHTSVAKVNHAIPFQNSLILFTNTSQFILKGDEVLSPKTTTIEYSTEFENSASVRPITTGRSIFFADNKFAFSGVREWYQVVRDEMYDALDITAHVPTYIPGQIVTLAGSTHDNILAVRADGDPDAVYIYKYLVGKDEKLQSSWSRYTLGGATILDMNWIDTSLYLLLQTNRGGSEPVNQMWIEKMTIEPGITDTDSEGTSLGFICNLDRRLDETQLVSQAYDAAADETTFGLPYQRRSLDDYQVVIRKDGLFDGQEYCVGSQLTVLNNFAGSVSVRVSGDFSTAEVFLGVKYSMEIELSRPYLKPHPNAPNYATGRYQLMYGHLIYHDSDYFRVEVQPSQGRTKRTTVFSGGLIGATAKIGERSNASGQLKFAIYGRNDQTTITIINDTPLSSSIMGLEYEAQFNPRASRIG